MVAKVSTAFKHSNSGPGSYESEANLQDVMVAAREEGQHKDGAFLDKDDDGQYPKRSGTFLTASAHIICAIIGAGVLSLGWTIAQLGWIFGPITILVFGLIAIYTNCLLAEAYRTGDELTGARNPTYMHAVKAHLGPRHQVFCAFMQYLQVFCIGVGYTVTGSLCLVAAKRSVCFHEHGGKRSAPCNFDNVPWMIMFGTLQLLFSQIPNFGSLWWLSYVAAAMSFAYSFIGLALSLGKSTQSGHDDYGTVWGANVNHTSAKAVWNVFTALGDAVFSFNLAPIVIEITNTLAQPPSEAKSMKRAVRIGVSISMAFYLSIGVLSYAGFGNSLPGNLLIGFGFFDPYWLVSTANIFVFIHLIGGYQVYLQPFMAFVETRIQFAFPSVPYLYNEYSFQCPGSGRVPFSILRIVSRSTIVCLTTLIAIILPFFNAIVGLIGAITFFPLTICFSILITVQVYLPCQMNLVRRQSPRFSLRWTALNALCLFALIISLASGIGSIESIIENLKNYKPFQSQSNAVASP